MSPSGTPEFVRQLRAAGIEPKSVIDTRVTFAHLIEVGRFAGQAITIGIEVPADFSTSPPSGPHISPRILPLNPSAPNHPERVAESPFGSDFEYWSRPYTDWGKDGQTVSAYLAFLRHLFASS